MGEIVRSHGPEVGINIQPLSVEDPRIFQLIQPLTQLIIKEAQMYESSNENIKSRLLRLNKFVNEIERNKGNNFRIQAFTDEDGREGLEVYRNGSLPERHDALRVTWGQVEDHHLLTYLFSNVKPDGTRDRNYNDIVGKYGVQNGKVSEGEFGFRYLDRITLYRIPTIKYTAYRLAIDSLNALYSLITGKDLPRGDIPEINSF